MSKDRIPTMSQSDVRIPTMPQGDVRIPTMPQTSQGRVATMPQTDANGRVATVPQTDASGRVATVQQGRKSGVAAGTTNSIIVRQNIVFDGDKDGKYTIESDNIISKDSGESQIYGCSRDGDSNKYVARVLISVTPDSDREKINQRNKVIEFLDKSYKNSSSHILPLVDHSTITIDNKEYYVEVYPFCKDGDLGKRKGKISFDEIQSEIVPAINEALKEFHDAGFVHRDVKPENLYKYDGKVVLGDFGITCDLREDGFATDKYKTGTLGYYAPELMSQAAIKASDYYSFGQTIWTLYSGEMMYQNILRRYSDYGIEEQRTQVNFAMLNNVYYGLEEINKDDAFLEVLIKGLLKYDPTARYDYDTVNRWIKNDNTLINNSVSQSNGQFSIPFRYKGVEYWNNTEVYNILVANWENAKELLYSGALKDFYKNNDFGIASEIDKIVKNYSSVSKKNGTEEEIELLNDIGMSKFLFTLNNGSALVWRNEQFTSFAEVSTKMGTMIDWDEDVVDFEDNYTELLASDLLGYWYKIITDDSDAYDPAMAEALSYICKLVSEEYDDFRNMMAYAVTYYLFRENEDEIIYEGCRSVDEIADKLVNYKENIYTYLKKIVDSPLLYGFLCAQGYYEIIDNMVKKFTSNGYEDLELFFDFLFSQVSDANILSKLSEFYANKGPNSYLIWWKNNLDLYKFKGSEALKLKAEIENIKVTCNDLTQMRDKFEELKQLSIRFRDLFVDNIFLKKMGLSKGKKQIVSDNMDAYWHYNFLDKEVPFGFGKYISCN